VSDMFAVISFRDEGPIKSEAGLRAAEVHNSRLEPLLHAEPGAPPPRHLIGSGRLVADTRRMLRAVGIDPDRPRSNGVLAFEAILTASPAFYEHGTPAEREERLAKWIEAQVAWATKRYGPHRIVSLVLHLDELTPHMHLVVLPLECKPDKRRRNRSVRWGLAGRTISGPGRYDAVQTHYAKAMAPFGLRRGEEKSGQKHRPVRAYLAELREKLEAAEQALAVAEEANRDAQQQRNRAAALGDLTRQHVEAAATAREEAATARDAARSMERALIGARDQLAAERQRLEDEREQLKREAADADAAVATEREKLAQERQALAADRARLDRERAKIAVDRAKIARERREAANETEAAAAMRAEAESVKAAADADRTAADERGRLIGRHFDALRPTFRAAAAFRQQVDALKGKSLTPAASAAQTAMRNMMAAARTAQMPAEEVRPDIAAAYLDMRQRGSGR